MTAIADELMRARAQARHVDPSVGSDLALTVSVGYEVAAQIHQRRLALGEQGVGRKIGFTNPRMWVRYGVAGPVWGHVYATSLHPFEAGRGYFNLAGLVEPKIEPEIVFGLKAAPPPSAAPDGLLACIDWVAHGFEIVQSHFPGWRFSGAQAIADFGLHAALLIGKPVPVGKLGDVQAVVRDFRITLFEGGAERDRGGGASVLGSPLNALSHLVELLAAAPQSPPLRPGESVTTGTLTAAWPVAPGQTWRTEIEGISLEGLEIHFP